MIFIKHTITSSQTMWPKNSSLPKQVDHVDFRLAEQPHRDSPVHGALAHVHLTLLVRVQAREERVGQVDQEHHGNHLTPVGVAFKKKYDIMMYVTLEILLKEVAWLFLTVLHEQ